MKTLDKYTFVALFLGLSVIALALVVLLKPTTPALAGTFLTSPVLGAATSSTAVAVTVSTRILATTTNALGNGTSYTRQYATICNPSANPVYVLMNNDKVANATHANVVIAAAAGYNVCFEITDRNQYNGSIQASSTNETSTNVLVTSYVY